MQSKTTIKYKETARILKEMMRKRRTTPQATLKDICLLIECVEKGDFTPMFRTLLYIKNSGEYCEYIEMINDLLADKENLK